MAYSDIKDPSAHFTTTLYTGDGSFQDITNNANAGNFKPDMIWTKSRSDNGGHSVQNSNVGAGEQVYPYLNAAEESVEGVRAFLTNGFSVGSNGTTNANGITFVAWQWKANGGTTSTNNDGNHTSVVQANQDAGFSIVTYTGTGNTSSTVGHGLGVTPNWIIFKRRSGTGNWDIQIDGTSRATLNLTEAGATNVLSSFSSTTFGLGSATSNEKNANGSTYVAYCFAEKQGYSKFGSYVGNGSEDGPFVYLGFKPAFLMMKETSSAGGNWVMFDNKRDTNNVTKHRLFPNLTNADNTTRDYIDLLSNGFKLRNTDADHNQNGQTMIYMAFAENPFVAGGVPTTAR
jgi:hypothetical protein